MEDTEYHTNVFFVARGHSATYPHPLLTAGRPQGPDDRTEETQAEDRYVFLSLCLVSFPLSDCFG